MIVTMIAIVIACKIALSNYHFLGRSWLGCCPLKAVSAAVKKRKLRYLDARCNVSSINHELQGWSFCLGRVCAEMVGKSVRYRTGLP